MVWQTKEHVSDFVGQDTTECPAEFMPAEGPEANCRRDLVTRQ